MKLHKVKSKNAVSYYVIESFRKPNGGGTSSRVVAKLGTAVELKQRLGDEIDIEQWAHDYVAKLNAAKKAKKPVQVKVSMTSGITYDMGEKRCFNAGYLMLQKILSSLDIKKMTKEIRTRHQFQFDFEKVLSDLVYARVLEPCSKQSSFNYCKDTLIEEPNYELHDVYRALDVIHEETDFIQSFLYQSSAKCIKRDTSALYYDCTNFFFEISQEDELRKFGHSKENRPNPIVQLGMFVDGSGIPLAFDVFPGNRNEQISLRPLENKIIKDFCLDTSTITVCTDAGLASFDNRAFNAQVKNAGKDSNKNIKLQYITIQPIKTLAKNEQDWSLAPGRSFVSNPIKADENQELVMVQLDREGWKCDGYEGVFSLDDIDEDEPANYNKIFYKEKYVLKTSKDGKKQLNDRLIVSYSIKYKHFMQRKRENDLNKARRLIEAKNNKKISFKTSSDVRKYIGCEHTTDDGKKAANSTYFIDESAIIEDSRFDGFYAVSTSIDENEMSVAKIIEVNRGRWEIEESFMLMKSELKSRPVYVRREERIKAHFTVCFLALLVFRILEKKVNTLSSELITAPELIKTLRNMTLTRFDKKKGFYTGAFTRTNITEAIHAFAGFRLDCALLTESDLKDMIKLTKKP